MKKRIVWIVILIEMILLVLNAFRFNKEESYVFTSDELYVAHADESTGEIIYEPGFYADHSNVQGSYVVTDLMSLGKGIYNVTVDYSAQTQGNWHTCYTIMQSEYDTSYNKSSNVVNCDQNAVYSGDNTISYLSWVRFGSDFRIRTGPETDSTGDDMYVLVNNISVTYMRMRTIVHESAKLLFSFILIDIIAFLYFFKRSETAEFLNGKELTIAGLSFIIILSSYPLASNKIYFGDDIFYHLRRLSYLAKGLACGQFPVHIYPEWDNGYGYAAGVGYGDLLLYPSAIMICLGSTIQFAYKFYILLTNVLSALISYRAFKRISDNDKVGLVCSGLFTLMGFRLHSVYAGATVGEFGAYTFLPLVVLGLWDIYHENNKKGEITLALGVTLTLSCHVLSTFILAMVIPLFCLILAEKTFNRQVLIPLFKALGLIVLLNLHFIVPLLDYMLFQGMRGNDMDNMLWDVGRDVVELLQFVPAPDMDTGGFIGLGFFSLIVLALAFGFVLAGKFGKETFGYVRIFIFSLLMIFLSINSIFYFVIKYNVPLLYKLLGTMQFPWHFLDVSSVLVVFWAAVVFGQMFRSDNKNTGSVMLAAICALCVIQSGYLLGQVIAVGKPITMYDDNFLDGCFEAEFTIAGSDMTLTEMEQDMVIRNGGDGVEASVVSRNGTTIIANVSNSTGEAIVVEAPLWGYRHYKARGEGQELQVSMAETNKLAIEIPSGFSGQIRIYFSEPWYWRLSEIVSLITLIYVCRAMGILGLLKKK